MPKRIKWTRQEINLLATLRDQNVPFSQIACRMGRSKSAVISAARNYGIAAPDDSKDNNVLRWRAKQLLISDYTCAATARITGAPLSVVKQVFDELSNA